MDAGKFVELLRFVSHAVDQGERREPLRGVLFEFRAPDRLVLVGTDGARCAIARVQHPHMMPDCDLIVSNAAEICAAFEGTPGEVVFFGDSVMDMTGRSVKLITLFGIYPDWRKAVDVLGRETHVAVQPRYVAEAATTMPAGPVVARAVRVSGGPALEMQAADDRARVIIMAVRQ